MNEPLAKSIHNEINSISGCRRSIYLLNQELNEIDEKIEALRRPKSPNGGSGIHSDSYSSNDGILLSLITDKGDIEDQIAYQQRKIDNATKRYNRILEQLPDNERKFLEEYFSTEYGKRQAVGEKYHYARAYNVAIDMIKRTKF